MQRICHLVLSLSLGFAVLSITSDSTVSTRPPPDNTAVDHATDLSPPLRMAVSEAIGRDNPVYHFDATTYTASNPTHAYYIHFGTVGVTIHKGQDTWHPELAKYGYGNTLMPVAEATFSHTSNRLTYQRGSLDEWYVNGEMGLQQGFTVHQPPPVNREGDLTLTLHMSGTMQAMLQDDTLHLTGENGSSLTYGGLYAYDANGETLPAQFSLSGDELVILVNDTDATYPLTIDPWVQQTKLTANDADTTDWFGQNVTLNGDTALIGARSDNCTAGSNCGSVYVFVRNGTAWSQQAKLTASDADEFDSFGGAVALDGDTALIGAHSDDCTAGTQCGSAYVFVRNGTSWSQQAKLIAADDPLNNLFGFAVAVSGDTALIGAYSDDEIGSNSGAAYVFTRNGTAWSQQTKILPADGAAFDYFGRAVSLDGDTALIGAFGDSCGVGGDCGSAYVFVRNGSTWGEQAKLVASDPGANDIFGGSLELDGDTALIGAYADDDNGFTSGSAYIFVRVGTSWVQQAKLTANDGAADDNFGYVVALSGNTALVGSRYDDDRGTDSGSAYLYARVGTTWSQETKLVASDGTTEDYFGYAVAVSGSTALVGAYGDNCIAGDECGSAYVYVTTPLNVSAACNGPNLEVSITSGDNPFNITATAGINTPVIGVGAGITTIIGPEKWDNLTVTETTGDHESINLGQFRCRSDEVSVPLTPAHRSHTVNAFPLFSWTAISIANNYRVFVFDDANPADRTVDIRQNSGGPTSMTLSVPLPDGRLFWRVRGRQNRLWSLWSIRFTLFKDPAVPVSVTGSTPVPMSDVAPPNNRSTLLPVPTVGPADGAPQAPTLPAPPNSR